ncbi:MAG: GNAT family N-acetyltransferase [Alistipes sp.]|jgi:ribosomal protein S18 acetylase RimI-like enzyme|nr:GNAT family N-acetyltransferase [Alistipes sp.]
MKIESLSATPFEVLARAFGAAFSDYEVQIDPAELRAMLRRRGFDPSLSFAAFDEAEHKGVIAGFTLNGIGTFNGRATAYDTGTGTLPAYRGEGLASRIFTASLPLLRRAGVEHYILEVLQHNEAAISLYRRLGFRVRREFNYFRATAEEVGAATGRAATENGSATGNPAENGNRAGISIRPIAPTDRVLFAPGFRDFEPSWQNSPEAIGRAPEDFIALGAFPPGAFLPGAFPRSEEPTPLGYIVFDPSAGDITQIAVCESHRRRGIGSALLCEMLRLNRAGSVKCLNTEIGRDGSIAGFLLARGIAHAGRQFEMGLEI